MTFSPPYRPSPNPGTSHGASVHRERELLVRSGLTPQEALAAATSVPASAFRLDDRGVIAPGKRADLVLVKGDPTRDIMATRDIVSVWKLGVEDDRASYRASVEKAKEEAAKAPQSTRRFYPCESAVARLRVGVYEPCHSSVVALQFEACPVGSATTASSGSKTEKSTTVGRPLKRL